MDTIFLFCALVGGTVLLCQLVMTLIGLGDSGFDLADDVPDSVEVDAADGFDGDLDDATQDHASSSWLFGIISFRTLVAAATFFGLAGMATRTGGLNLPLQLVIAIVSGGAAMVLVHSLMRSFYQLSQSGTLRISNTIGKTASVYIPIPGGNSGQGKVQVKVQDRLEEFPAVTSDEGRIGTGAKVVVIGVVSGNTLEVEALNEPVEAEA